MTLLKKNADELIRLLRKLGGCSEETEKAAGIIKGVLRKKGKILVFGNGGSAADANHFAAELVCRFEKNRKALPALSLNSDISVMTAVSNDFGYKEVFARQIEALGRAQDAVVAISTSGKSDNIIEACRAAAKKKMKIIVLTGMNGLPDGEKADAVIAAPSVRTARIQEAHELILHTICGLLENDM